MFGSPGPARRPARPRAGAHCPPSVDETLSHRVFDLVSKLPLKAIASFLPAGMTSTAFAPSCRPWDRRPSSTRVDAALSRHLLRQFHPLIGWAATVGGLILIAITVATEFLTRQPSRDAAGGRRRSHGARRNRAAAMPRSCRPWAWAAASTSCGTIYNRRNLRRPAARRRHRRRHGRPLREPIPTHDPAVGRRLASAPGWLINQQATAGIIIASSILAARAGAPVEVTLALLARSSLVARQELAAAERPAGHDTADEQRVNCRAQGNADAQKR